MDISSLFITDVPSTIAKAKKLKSEQKIDKAISTLEAGLAKFPNNYDIMLEIANINIWIRKYTEAVRIIRNMLKLHRNRQQDIIEYINDEYSAHKDSFELAELAFDTSLEKKDFDACIKYLSSMDKGFINKIKTKFQQQINKISKDENYVDINTPTAFTLFIKNLAYYYGLALINLTENKYNEMINYFAKIADKVPSEIPFLINFFERLERQYIGNENTSLFLCTLYTKSSAFDKAIEKSKSLISPEKTSRDSNLLDELIKQLVIITETSSEPFKTHSRTLLADAYYKRNLIESAIKEYNILRKQDTSKIDFVIARISSILKSYPDNITARLSLCEAYLDKKDYTYILEEYKKIYSANPSAIDTIAEQLQVYISMYPESTQLCFILGEVNLWANKLDQSAIAFMQAYQRDRSSSKTVVNYISEILEKDINNIWACMVLSDILIAEGNWESAITVLRHIANIEKTSIDYVIEKYKEITSYQPDIPSVYVALGDAFIVEEKYLHSVENYIIAMEKLQGIQPNIIIKIDSILRKVYKSSIENLEEWKSIITRLIKIYTALIKSNPDNLLLYFASAQCYLVYGNYESASEIYKRILSLKILPQQEKDRLELVVDGYNQILLKDTNNIKIRFLLVENLINAKDFSSAISQLTAILNINQDSFNDVIKWYYKILSIDDKNSEIYKAIATAFFERKLYDQTINECEKAIHRLGELSATFAFPMLAESYLEKGQLNNAVNYYDKSLSVWNKDKSAINIDSIISGYRRIVDIDSTNVPVHLGLLKVFASIEDFKSAIDEQNILLEISPKEEISNLLDNLIESCVQWLNTDKTNPAIYYQLGSLYIHKGNYERAIQEFSTSAQLSQDYLDKIIGKLEEIIKLEPKNIPALFTLAKLLKQKSIYSKAITLLLDVFSANPTYIHSIIKELKDIIRLDSKNIDARYALVRIYLGKGMFKEASNLLNEMVEIDENEIPRAMNGYNYILTKDKSNIDVKYSIADLHIRKKEISKALELFNAIMDSSKESHNEINRVIQKLESIIESNPQNTDILFLLGDLYLKKYELDKAREIYEKIADISDNKIDEIINRLNKLLSLQSKNSTLLFSIGNLYYRKDDYKKAIEYFKDAIKNTDNAELLMKLHLLIGLASRNIAKKIENERGDKKEILEYYSNAEIEINTAKALDTDRKNFYKMIKELNEKSIEKEIKKKINLWEKEPYNEKLRISIAELFIDKGDISNALAWLNFDSQDENISANRLILWTLCMLKEKNYSAIIENVGSFVWKMEKMGEEKKKLLYLLARVYEEVGNLPASISSLKQIIKDYPNDEIANKKLADNYKLIVERQLKDKCAVLVGM